MTQFDRIVLDLYETDTVFAIDTWSTIERVPSVVRRYWGASDKSWEDFQQAVNRYKSHSGE